MGTDGEVNAEWPQVGEVWFVRMVARLDLVEATIIDVTPMTVEIEWDDVLAPNHPKYLRRARYAHKDITLVERKETGGDDDTA